MKRSTLNLIPLVLLLLLALRTEGQLLSNFTGFNSSTGFNNAVRAVAEQSDGKLIVGGAFSTYKGVTVNGICRLLQNGELDTTFVNTTAGITGVGNGVVLSLKVLPDDRILVGGDYSTIGGQLRYSVARLNKDGSLDQTFNPNFGSSLTISPKQVYAIEILPNGDYAFGGIHVNQSNNIGVCSPNGLVQNITTLTGGGNAVTDLKNYPGNRLLVSGTFGVGNRFIDRINLSNWTSDPTFTPYFQNFQANGFNARINTMHVLADGRIIIGGDFTFFAQSTFGQASAGRLARLDTNGRFDGTYAVGNGFNGRVWQITPAPAALGAGNLVICGEFTSYNGTTTNRMAVISPTATLVNSGNYANNLVYTTFVTKTENFLVVGGGYGSFNGVTGTNGIVLLNASTCLKPVFLQYPGDQFITSGSSRVLQASVLPQTVSDFTWFKNGSFNSFTAASTSSSLTIPSFSQSDTGLYRIDLSGTCGVNTGPGFRLRLITAPILNPLSADTTICPNSAFNLTASANGAQINYSWFQGNTLRASGATLNFPSLTAFDTGTWKVVASNVAGSDSAFIRIRFPQPTLINLITSTASSACLGDTVSFIVSASGFQLTYLWQKGNNSIGGANGSTYTINGVTSTDFGIGGQGYRVLITDGCNNMLFSPRVNLSQRSTPGTPFINGVSSICPAFPDTVVYSTGTQALVYQWTLPAGWTGSSNTSSISVFPGAFGGTLSLRVKDTACFSAAATRFIGTQSPTRLDSGLVRYWSFNQQDSLRDLVAGVTATLAGAFSPLTTSVSSTSNTIRLVTTAPLAPSSPTSVVLRVNYFTTNSGSFVTLIGSNETTLPAGHPVLVVSTTGRLQAWSNAGAAIGTGTALQAGILNTIVLNRNGSSFRIFLNGVAVDSGTNISQAPIGRFFNNRPSFETQGLRGVIEEVRIYNRLLTDGEVSVLTEAPYVEGPWRYTLPICAGSALNSSLSLTSQPNAFQWFINGQTVAGATTSSFNIPSLSSSDTLVSVSARSGCAILRLNRRPTFLAPAGTLPISGPDTVCALEQVTFSTSQPGTWSIPSAPVPFNPVVRYKFDGTRTNAANDAGTPLLLNPANIFAQPLGQYVADKHGAAGKAYRFTQTSEAMRSAGTNLPTSGQPTTWSFWFRNTSNGDKAYLMYNQTGGSIQTVYIYRRNGQIGVSNSRDFNQGQRIQFNLPYDTQWHHLVVTISNLNVTTLYIDSIQRATGTISFAHTGLTTYSIGQGDNINTAAGAPCDFEIDELVLYNAVLSQTQVGQLFTNGHNGLYTVFNTSNQNIIQNFTSTQTIVLNRTNVSSGCTSTVSKTVVVNPLPAVSINLSGGILTTTSIGATGFQWFRNDTLIAGATSATFQPAQSGQYSVRAIGANGCENFSPRLSFIVSGLTSEQWTAEIAAYPNPFDQEINLVLPRSAEFRLINLLGQEVMGGHLPESNTTLQTEGLAKSTYLLMLKSGDSIHTFKMIK